MTHLDLCFGVCLLLTSFILIASSYSQVASSIARVPPRFHDGGRYNHHHETWSNASTAATFTKLGPIRTTWHLCTTSQSNTKAWFLLLFSHTTKTNDICEHFLSKHDTQDHFWQSAESPNLLIITWSAMWHEKIKRERDRERSFVFNGDKVQTSYKQKSNKKETNISRGTIMEERREKGWYNKVVNTHHDV